MKRLTVAGIVIAGLILVAAFLAMSLKADEECAKKEHKYVGVGKCKMCHKSEKKGDQYSQWEKSEHAKAYETLAGEKAKKIAAEKGIEDPQKSEKCLKCHLTGFGLKPEAFEESFRKEFGVQCEACHGPASDFAKLSVMKDKKEAEAHGLTITPDEKLCVKCHNEESPTYKPFCLAHFYQKVTHPNPALEHAERVIKCTCEKKQDLKINKDGSSVFVEPEKKCH